VTDEEKELEQAIKDAVKLHGHLGPFLVIGVRMGKLAEKILNTEAEGRMKLEITLKTPIVTPFSCTIDGIQSATSCTVGNQRLRIEGARKEITAHFRLDDSGKALNMSLNPRVMQDLRRKLSEGASNEELAAQIASMKIGQLFTLEKKQTPAAPKQPRKVGTDRQDLETARRRLGEKGLTLSIVKERKILFETTSHGISGFLKAIDECEDELTGASVADRVAGKAIALLSVFAKIKAVYAPILSKKAKAVFEKNGVHIEWDQLVENILNVNQKRRCPFEEAATRITDPRDAHRRLKTLQGSLEKCG
jgi:formylmethanofuran dehydrogenase subunit E